MIDAIMLLLMPSVHRRGTEKALAIYELDVKMEAIQAFFINDFV